MKKLLILFLLFPYVIYSQVKPHVSTNKPGIVGKPTHNPPDVVNNYTEALSYDICSNVITVSNSIKFSMGDTVLLIQMQGALIDTSNTSSFGTILDYRNAGNYEFNYISQKSGNQLTFKNKLTKTYDIPTGVVQLVRVPHYSDTLLGSGLTCAAWDGSKGGVLAVIASGTLSSLGPMDVQGLGFRKDKVITICCRLPIVFKITTIIQTQVR